MPGFIQQSQSTGKPSDSEKAVNGLDVIATPAGIVTSSKMDDLRNGHSYVNGEHPLVNGHHSNDVSTMASASHLHEPCAVEEESGLLPPEIHHISTGYVSLSALVERLAQETFNDLGNMINDLADMTLEQPRANGVLSHATHLVNGNSAGKSDANVQKKLRVLNFTNNWRPKFIKILVLSQWARQAEAVSRVIDLKHWQDIQRMEYEGATTAMGELKRLMVAMKEPSPDTKTALEILSLGKASWLPDFGYLPVEPLSTRQLLSALRRINTLLSIRLNLYESILPIFRDFTVASGRATFRVKDEFEVDLSLADEDPTSQLYFIDIRFTFSPSLSSLPAGMLRSDLEARANDVLNRDRLQGLFDLLHNLVLTHKLNILRSQAYNMSRGYWSEHLVVEPVRRSVAVQYWSNRPGGKNWIEIGIRRGKEKRVAYADVVQRVSSVSMRWFRGGKEVHDFDVNLQLENLSLEHILKQVIAQHSSYIFNSIATKLLTGLLYSSGCLRVKDRASDTEPLEASLFIQLTATTSIKIVQEPVSGRFAIQPSSPLNSRAEYELNRLISPLTEAPSQLSYLRSLVSVDEVEKNAHGLGWENVKSINPDKETMQKYFPKAIFQTRFFRRQDWTRRWILAFTTNLEGDLWWVVELSSSKSSPEEAQERAPSERIFNAAYGVPLGTYQTPVFASSHDTLARVEWTAAGMISLHSDTSALHDELQHSIVISSATASTFAMLLQTPNPISLLAKRKESSQKSRKALNNPKAHDTVKLLYKGINPKTRAAVRVAVARVKKPISNLKVIISKIPNLTIACSSINGASLGDPPLESDLQLSLVHRVGESCIPELIDRLIALERLLEYVFTLENNHLPITSASLSDINFVYTSTPPKLLTASINFPLDGPMHLSFPARNPHLRIQDYLLSWLSKQGLVPVLALLRLTFPLLSALTTLEKSHKANDISIIARSEQWYQVRYLPPLPRGGFDITLRLRHDQPYWFILEFSIRKVDALVDEEVWTQLLAGVTRGKGSGWRGVKGGIIAEDSRGVGEVVMRLDEVFRDGRVVVKGKVGGSAGGKGEGEEKAEEKKGEQSTTTRPGKRKAEGQVVEID